MLPEINTVQGYLLYSFLAYLFILFMGWLANPTAERLKDDYINSTKNMNQGLKMREKQKEAV